MVKQAHECKNTGELYEQGYQAVLLDRDCWQTNYMHENAEPFEVTCPCGIRRRIEMERFGYDFTPTPFLWFKPKRETGTYSRIIATRLPNA